MFVVDIYIEDSCDLLFFNSILFEIFEFKIHVLLELSILCIANNISDVSDTVNC